MLDLEETFVFDAVVHAYNTAQSNYRNERHAEGITEMIYGTVEGSSPPGYKLTREGFIRDWDVEETANMLYFESDTDMATFHPTPLYAYHDGLVANEKAAEVKQRWSDRFRVFGTVDPLNGQDALDELERQVEEFDPIGLKLYPSHWTETSHKGWAMDDTEVAYPVFEKALDLGIDHIAIHKAIPFGPVPRETYQPGDIDGPAENFPEIDFSIVHGGFAFTEETAWQIARFPNVYINMESLPAILLGNERRFAEIMGELISIGGEDMYDKMFWSSAAMALHPQPQLEQFRDFEYPDDVRESASPLGKLPQITDEHKRKMLGQNYADLIGLDVDEARSGIKDDEFSQQQAETGLADPYSTTEAAQEVF